MTYKEAKALFEEDLKDGKCSDTCPECNAREIAITAIGKQISIKPIGRHTSYKCPVCDRRVRSGKGSSSRGVDHFCQRCGQALDWSDTE